MIGILTINHNQDVADFRFPGESADVVIVSVVVVITSAAYAVTSAVSAVTTVASGHPVDAFLHDAPAHARPPLARLSLARSPPAARLLARPPSAIDEFDAAIEFVDFFI